jgi:hypothetical protein
MSSYYYRKTLSLIHIKTGTWREHFPLRRCRSCINILKTHNRTSVGTVLLDKLIVVLLVKKYSAFCRAQKLIIVLKQPAVGPYPEPD